MSIKKDMKLPAGVIPWRVAVLAAPGFDHPDLAPALRRRLWPLLSRQEAGRAIDLMGAGGEPVSVAAGQLAAARKWSHTMLGSCCEMGRGVSRRTLAALLANTDAAVFVYAGPDRPPVLIRLADLADWLQVPVRWVRVA